MMALALTACSPDEFDSPSQAGIPQVGQADVSVNVDQTTNQVTLTMNNKGCYPLWYIPNGTKTVYSTVNGLKRIFATAGEYQVKYQIGNANGVSLGMDSVSFKIDNTIFNFDQYFNLMAGGSEGSGSSKTWRIDNSVAQHLGCGPSGTTGTEWYGAQPDEKAGTGLYESSITLTTEKQYTFDPGKGGCVYVNTGCTIFPESHQDVDFSAPVEAQTVSYDFDVVGDNLYLTLPAETLFPYIANDAQYKSPVRFLIESVTPKQMVLVYDNGEIAWHFILTSGERATVFEGFDYDSDCNMWRTAHFTTETFYAQGGDWAACPEPIGLDISDMKNVKVSLPCQTNMQWQAQVKLFSDQTTNAATNYDFSLVMNSDKDLNGVTVKLVKHGDDGTFYFTDQIDLKAYEAYIFWKSDMAGIDMENVDLVLDFGGCQAGTNVTVQNIVLKEHGCDDGTVLPVDDTPVFNGYNYDNDCNQWRTAQFTTETFYAQGGDWAACPEPIGLNTSDMKNVKISLPCETNMQWQAQVKLFSDIASNSATNYDFSLVMNTDKDLRGATVKLVKHGDDGTFFFTDQIDVKAYEPYIFYKSDMAGIDMENVDLVLDFGGCQAGTNVTVENIVFKEHGCDDGAGQPGQGGGGDAPELVYDSADNLWKTAIDDARDYTTEFYYATGGAWEPCPEPIGFAHDGKTITIDLPIETMNQWQAQVKIHTNIPGDADTPYDFSCKLTADKAMNGATVKLTQDGDDGNFFFADQVELPAYEEVTYTATGRLLPTGGAEKLMMVFDFGGCQAGTRVTISDIILQKSK